MCTVIAALTGLNIVTDVMSQAAQYSSAAANYYSNAIAANEAARLKYGQTNAEQEYNNIQATNQRLEEQRKIYQAQGTALASSQNEGNSLNMTLLDLARQGSMNIAQIDQAQKYRNANYDTQREALKAENQARINSVPKPEKPSALALAISGLGHVANGYITSKQLKAKMPTSESMGGGNLNIPPIGQTITSNYKDPYELGKRIRYAGS